MRVFFIVLFFIRFYVFTINFITLIQTPTKIRQTENETKRALRYLTDDRHLNIMIVVLAVTYSATYQWKFKCD